jgi:hypothetical protein
MTGMEYQMPNWYYFTWLSGDFKVERFVHRLDQNSLAIGTKDVAEFAKGTITGMQPWDMIRE